MHMGCVAVAPWAPSSVNHRREIAVAGAAVEHKLDAGKTKKRKSAKQTMSAVTEEEQEHDAVQSKGRIKFMSLQAQQRSTHHCGRHVVDIGARNVRSQATHFRG